MKGFWSTFFIFLLWATAGIYYIHVKESNNTSKESSVEILTEKKAAAISTPITNTQPKIMEPAFGTPEIDSLISPEIVEDTITPFQTAPSNIEKNDIYINNDNTNIDSQLLADEIKKSIAISDTIDIDKDEPAIEYRKESTIINNSNAISQVFYPTYANTDLILDKELIAYATELKKILTENPNKRVTVIGHTDNVGNAEDNFRIGLKKSRQIKWYLTARRGIKRSRVSAISRGESSPTESNSSVWGRKKNNRIEIIVD